jgi:hypothetical protein
MRKFEFRHLDICPFGNLGKYDSAIAPSLNNNKNKKIENSGSHSGKKNDHRRR